MFFRNSVESVFYIYENDGKAAAIHYLVLCPRAVSQNEASTPIPIKHEYLNKKSLKESHCRSLVLYFNLKV